MSDGGNGTTHVQRVHATLLLRDVSFDVMRTIRLAREWRLGTKIAEGGFAEVMAATSSDPNQRVVVKVVKKLPGASR